jgi:hypothetical protein
MTKNINANSPCLPVLDKFDVIYVGLHSAMVTCQAPMVCNKLSGVTSQSAMVWHTKVWWCRSTHQKAMACKYFRLEYFLYLSHDGTMVQYQCNLSPALSKIYSWPSLRQIDASVWSSGFMKDIRWRHKRQLHAQLDLSMPKPSHSGVAFL